MISHAQRWEQVQKRIELALAKAKRSPESLTVLAVSKQKPAADIEALTHLGFVHFGENYVAEMLEKSESLASCDLQWHFIGRLQSNKFRKMLRSVSFVHGLYKLAHAKKLDALAEEMQVRPKVLLQVNMAGEQSKGGVAPDEVASLVQACLQFSHLRCVGLMTFPPQGDPEENRVYFRALRLLRDQLKQDFSLEGFDDLSMGVSSDFEVAIEEGATIIRLGSVLFGPR